MTKKQFVSIGKLLLPSLQGYVVDGSIVFRPPVGHTLSGLCFERRETADSFYLWVFLMPLCIPEDHITLSFGKRLGGGSHSWEASSRELIPSLLDAVDREAIPFLEGLETPGDVVSRIQNLNLPKDAFYRYEALGYMLARCGRPKEAIANLDRTIELLGDGRAGRCGIMVDRGKVTCVPLGPRPEWEKRAKDRAATLRDRLINDPVAVPLLLGSWEQESLRNLGLLGYR
jgi:hypothetical protein